MARSESNRVKDRIPPEVRRQTRSADLPDADWYAGRQYEPRETPDDIVVGGEAGARQRSEQGIAAHRAELRHRLTTIIGRLRGRRQRAQQRRRPA